MPLPSEKDETPPPAPRRSLLGLHRLRTWFRELLRAHLSPRETGLAVGIGIFIGVLPIYGLHLVACLVAARRLGLNHALVYAAANISNPFFAPFLVAAGIYLGSLLRTGHPPATLELGEGAFWKIAAEAPMLFLDCCIGSVVIGASLGALLGGLAAWGMTYWEGRGST